LVKQRTQQLIGLNQQLEEDIAARKLAEQALAEKARELERTNEILENLSLLDDLTGLYNRKGFLALVAHRLKLAQRSRSPFSIAFIDLDGLKQINDAFGHEEGDRALRDTAAVLRDSFRQSDVIARLGGDEFAIFIGEADVEKIAARIENKLAGYRRAADRRYVLSFSIGIVPGSSAEDAKLEALLKRADTLMYQQKRQKRAGPASEARPSAWPSSPAR
jgi:diguanylate cyclase (GGDEF)-like protein